MIDYKKLSKKELSAITNDIHGEFIRRSAEEDNAKRVFTAEEKQKIAKWKREYRRLSNGVVKNFKWFAGITFNISVILEDDDGNEITVAINEVKFKSGTEEQRDLLSDMITGYISRDHLTVVEEDIVPEVKELIVEVRDSINAITIEADKMANDHRIDYWDFWEEFIVD